MKDVVIMRDLLFDSRVINSTTIYDTAQFKTYVEFTVTISASTDSIDARYTGTVVSVNDIPGS